MLQGSLHNEVSYKICPLADFLRRAHAVHAAAEAVQMTRIVRATIPSMYK